MSPEGPEWNDCEYSTSQAEIRHASVVIRKSLQARKEAADALKLDRKLYWVHSAVLLQSWRKCCSVGSSVRKAKSNEACTR